MSMTLIVLKPDDVTAAYTQETDNAGVLCGETRVSGAGVGETWPCAPLYLSTCVPRAYIMS